MNDKLLHALFGGLIAWRLIEINFHWLLVLVIVAIFGVAKEMYDYKSHGLFDYKDLVATMSGGVVLLLTELFL